MPKTYSQNWKVQKITNNSDKHVQLHQISSFCPIMMSLRAALPRIDQFQHGRPLQPSNWSVPILTRELSSSPNHQIRTQSVRRRKKQTQRVTSTTRVASWPSKISLIWIEIKMWINRQRPRKPTSPSPATTNHKRALASHRTIFIRNQQCRAKQSKFKAPIHEI